MAIANKKQKLVRAAVVAGLVTALGVGQLAANASPYTHPSVVTTAPVMTMPVLAVTTGEPKPVAYTVAEAGSQMIVGGRFNAVENGNRTVTYNRSNVVAFDATTGAVSTTFAPQVNGDVWGAWSDGASVYIGGGFTTVNGVTRPALAKLSLATGELDTSFQPTFTGARVSDIDMVHGQLIVSGTFQKRIVSLNPNTGKPTTYLNHVVGGRLPNSNSAQVFHFDVSPDGQHLIGVGNFVTVDGADRPRVFMLDLGDDSDDAVVVELRAARPEVHVEPCECPGLRPRRRVLARQLVVRLRVLWFHVAAGIQGPDAVRRSVAVRDQQP